jgi:hypothetical protein
VDDVKGEKSMSDVNPLGPMMHLKEIEREALALRAATMKGRPWVLNSASGWVMRFLKRLGISLGAMSAGDGAHVRRR